MSFAGLVEPLLAGKDLTDTQATDLMRYLIGGSATDAQLGAVMGMLRAKKCTASELAAFAQVMRNEIVAPRHDFDNLVDTCGTGGGIPSFNISTAAAFVSVAAGVRIAKHGNRGVARKCGSADVLEALGAKIQTTWEVLISMLEHVGLGFLYAPAHHPAIRHVSRARQELGFRTLFNQIGPLANPADAKRQLVGVYDESMVRPMAEALGRLGAHRALIVHGMDGLDEVSPVSPTRYALLWDGELSDGILTPAGFGIEPVDPSLILPGKDTEENAKFLRDAISDLENPRSVAILPSAACAIWIAGLTRDRISATDMAREAISSGAALAKLEEFVAESQAV